MADNAFVKIGTALLKHQVKKLVGEETLGVIGEELANLSGDKFDAWLGNKSTLEDLEKAAATAHENFRGKINDEEIEQWMVMLPIHNLPAVLSAIEELPISPDETKLENALREAIALNWKKLSPVQVENVVSAYLSSLRNALLPVEKQTLMVVGRSVLRTEDKVDRLLNIVNIYASMKQKDSLLEESLGKIDNSKKRLKVFLCHSSLDKNLVRDIYFRLRDAGIDPWLDKENILPGQNWRQAIEKAIRSSDAVIVCLSKSSINKAGYAQKEISMALDVADEQPENSIFVIPLRLEECNVPDRLSHIHYVDFFDSDGFTKLMKALNVRLDELISRL